MILTAERVIKVFKKCLCAESDDPKKRKEVYGVRVHAYFDMERLKKQEPKITQLLEELPEEFRKEIGGGWSFLQMCQDKNGVLWGEHHHVDLLVCLGQGIGKLKISPEKMWHLYPAGMPYVTIDLD